MEPQTRSSTKIAIVGVPSCAGARRPGQDQAPSALRRAGLVSSLGNLGLEVIDHGDLPRVAFRPDPEDPSARNGGLVRGVAGEVAAKVQEVAASGALPVVLGGDCTVTIGVAAGLLEARSSLGLLYFDGDLDLNTPDTTPSGAYDGMVTAHLLGRGCAELARVGPRYPLLQAWQLAYFGYNERAGGIDPWELSDLERSASLRYPVETIRADPLGVAGKALRDLEDRVDRILVHFDLDVTNTPAVDVFHAEGLPLATAASILGLLLASAKCAGLVVTEFNAGLDENGTVARELASRLGESLAAGRSSRAGGASTPR